jgi:uncharacterized protein
LASFVAATAWPAETLPPAPTQYFNDYAHAVTPAVTATLNQQLEAFERQTSNQVVVAVFQKLPSDSSIEDYTHRVMESWKVGQRIKNNGVGLFVFISNRQARIEVNYGLEGALPDAVCKNIIDSEIAPHFRTGAYAAGLASGIAAIEQAIKGEYKGTGATAAGAKSNGWGGVWWFLAFIAVLVLGSVNTRFSRGGTNYDRNGRRMFAGALLFGLFGGGMGGRGMGGGGFSGGGGIGGGGGASGGW